MRIGILGSGLMGGKLGTLFARAGHDVVFSYSHSRSKLEALAREAGSSARAGTPSEAAQDADVLLLAVHWSRVDDVLKQAGDVSGKVLVTCSLPMNARRHGARAWRTRPRARRSWRRRRAARASSRRSARCRAKCCSPCSKRGSGKRRPSLVYCGDDDEGEEVGRDADPRRRLRSGGRRAARGGALHRAVHAAHREAGLRRQRRAGSSRTGSSTTRSEADWR